MKNIRILLVDDHSLVRKGLVALINRSHHKWELFEAENGVQAMIRSRELKPDVILMDYIMPKMDGIRASAWITREFPNTRIILVTMDPGPEVVMQLIDAGIRGLVPKQSTDEELILAIEEVLQGNIHIVGHAAKIAREYQSRLLKPHRPKKHKLHPLLSDREIEVLNAIVKGFGVQRISDLLAISTRTVEGHKAKLFKKCQVHSINELVHFAFNNNLVVL
jgi:two-component system, NarL family, response regulator NreC